MEQWTVLKKAGFREDEIRVWQQKEPAVNSREDAMARVIEGVLAGGVIGGLAVFFFDHRGSPGLVANR